MAFSQNFDSRMMYTKKSISEKVFEISQ